MTVLISPNDIKLTTFKEKNKPMKNREIIQFINRYCANKEDLDVNSNADLAYAILAHGYLYVQPGNPTEKFTLRVIEALKVGATDGFNNYLEDECCSWSLDEWIRISMASTALQVAREEFDKKYFKKQIKILEPDEECDDVLLDKYLNLMNKEQLVAFMDEVNYYRAHYLTFTCIDRIKLGGVSQCRRAEKWGVIFLGKSDDFICSRGIGRKGLVDISPLAVLEDRLGIAKMSFGIRRSQNYDDVALLAKLVDGCAPFRTEFFEPFCGADTVHGRDVKLRPGIGDLIIKSGFGANSLYPNRIIIGIPFAYKIIDKSYFFISKLL